jgi:hypothetical protein
MPPESHREPDSTIFKEAKGHLLSLKRKHDARLASEIESALGYSIASLAGQTSLLNEFLGHDSANIRELVIIYIIRFEPKAEQWDEIFRRCARTDPAASVRAVAIAAIATLAGRQRDGRDVAFLEEIAADANEQTEVRQSAQFAISGIDLALRRAPIRELRSHFRSLLEFGVNDEASGE